MDAPQAPVSSFQVASDRNQVQVVSGTIAAGWDDPPSSDTASNVDEAESNETAEIVDASIPIDQIVASRQTALALRIESKDNPSRRWKLKDTSRTTPAPNPIPAKLVLKPTASMIQYKALHPAIYRFVEPLSDIEKLAERLNVLGWRAEANRIWPYVKDDFLALVSLDNTASEHLISSMMRNLVGAILEELQRHSRDDPRNYATVRGTLALEQYEVRGVTDQIYGSRGKFILAVELKTAKSWRDGDYWYVKSRGVQLLNALYACHCPALLVTQSQFKIFLESKDRTRISTYPAEAAAPGALLYDRFLASLGWLPTRYNLYWTLVICLMQAPLKANATIKPTVAEPNELTLETVARPANHSAHSTKETPQGPTRTGAIRETTPPSPTPNRGQGSRALGEPAEAAEAAEAAEPAEAAGLMPRFYTGVNDAYGKPIYRLVYVSPPQAAGFSSDELASDSCETEDRSLGEEKVALPHHDSAVAL